MQIKIISLISFNLKMYLHKEFVEILECLLQLFYRLNRFIITTINNV